jgi:hypothetical protein
VTFRKRFGEIIAARSARQQRAVYLGQAVGITGHQARWSSVTPRSSPQTSEPVSGDEPSWRVVRIAIESILDASTMFGLVLPAH